MLLVLSTSIANKPINSALPDELKTYLEMVGLSPYLLNASTIVIIRFNIIDVNPLNECQKITCTIKSNVNALEKTR